MSKTSPDSLGEKRKIMLPSFNVEERIMKLNIRSSQIRHVYGSA